MNDKMLPVKFKVLCIYILAMITINCTSWRGNLCYAYETNTARVATFPASLQLLGDESFVGTSFETVIFRDQLKSIGMQVFDNCYILTDVYSPGSIESIGEDAFPKGILFHGIAESYVQKWTGEHNFDFVVDDIWDTYTVPIRILIQYTIGAFCFIFPADIKMLIRIRRRKDEFVKSMRPQDRPELYPINYRFP